jgi:vacuolar-type H+-ATPase subunit H
VAEAEAKAAAAESKISEAEQEAGRIVEDARKEAEQIASRTTEDAGKGADDAAGAAEAEKEASRILQEAKAAAEREAQDIIAQAQQTADHIIEETEKRADQHTGRTDGPELSANRLLDEARKKAEQDARTVRQDIYQLLATAKKNKVPEDNVRAVLDKVHQNLVSLADGLAKSQAESRAPRQTPAADMVARDRTDAELPSPVPEQVSGNADETSSLFQGTIEIALPPPIGFEEMIDFHRQLKGVSGLDVLNLGGSVDKGITIRAYLASPTPLLQVLREIPVVGDVSEELPGTSTRVPGRREGEHPPIRRIIVTTRR